MKGEQRVDAVLPRCSRECQDDDAVDDIEGTAETAAGKYDISSAIDDGAASTLTSEARAKVISPMYS